MNSLLTIFLIFFALLFAGVPIGVAIGGAALLILWIDPSIPADLSFIFQSMFVPLDSFVLLAIPMFTLSGAIMTRGGMSKKLFDFFMYFVGNRVAGMPCAVIITCLFYGMLSGSSPATVIAVGSMTVPILLEMGYDRRFSVATVTVAGGLGIIIPPSIPFIIYGNSTGVSVGALFLGGILPGCVCAVCLMVYAYFYCKRKGEDRERIDEHVRMLRERGFWDVFKESFWALLAPVFILGGIYGGFVTPTEAAVISVVYAALACMFAYKSLKFKDLYDVLKLSAASIAPMLYIVATAVMFGKVLTFMRGQDVIADFLANTFDSKVATILLAMGLLLLLGAVMDELPLILVLAPIFNRMAAMLGIHPVHMGVLIIVTLTIGFFAPPVGVNLYVAAALPGNVKFIELAKAVMPYLCMFVVAALIVAFVPWLSLALI